MSVTVPADYTGRFAITKNAYNVTNIQQVIDDVEPTIMNQLFGVDLLNLYYAGITASDPLYTFLRDPFFYQTECGNIVESKGIKTMLLGFVYFKYFAQQHSKATTVGKVVPKPENSEYANDVDANLISRQNDSVKTYRAIQAYLRDKRDDYPDFKGIEKLITNWF